MTRDTGKVASIKANISKSRQFFNHAFKEAFGREWEWHVNGELNHPATSDDVEVQFFYKGFRAGKISQKEYREEINTINELIAEHARLGQKIEKLLNKVII